MWRRPREGPCGHPGTGTLAASAPVANCGWPAHEVLHEAIAPTGWRIGKRFFSLCPFKWLAGGFAGSRREKKRRPGSGMESHSLAAPPRLTERAKRCVLPWLTVPLPSASARRPALVRVSRRKACRRLKQADNGLDTAQYYPRRAVPSGGRGRWCRRQTMKASGRAIDIVSVVLYVCVYGIAVVGWSPVLATQRWSRPLLPSWVKGLLGSPQVSAAIRLPHRQREKINAAQCRSC